MGEALQHPWAGVALLALVAGLLRLALGRWLPRPGPGGGPWRWGIDGGLALGCAAVSGGLAATLLWPAHIHGDVFLTADFHEYCAGVERFRGGELNSFLHKRSSLALLPATLLSWPLGVLGGLQAAAVLSVGITGAALYLWGRALHGRTAGVAAALMALAFGPWVLNTRHLTSYPALGACFALAAAAGAVAARRRTPLALALGGAGAGLALLADARGLIFALPVLALTLAAALGARPREWPPRLAAALAPLLVSYGLGVLCYSPGAYSLEQQVDVRPLFHRAGMRGPTYDPPWEVPDGFVWGRSSPLGIPSTLGFLWSQSRIPAPDRDWSGVPSPELRPAVIGSWLPLLSVALALSVAGLVRRRWRLAALVATLAPFAVALRGAATMVEVEPRFLAHGWTGGALLLGVALGVALDGLAPATPGPAEPPPGSGRRQLARIAVLAAVLIVLVTGLVPTWFGPRAGWRHRWRSTVGEVHAAMAGQLPTGEPDHVLEMHRTCHEALDRDAGNGGYTVPAEEAP